MAPTSNAEKCRKYREKKKENYRKNDALRKKHSRLLLKLKDKGEYNLQKEKEKLRKRAEREKKKISSEPIPPATPTAASTLEPSTSASGSSSAFKHRCTKQRYMKKIEKYLPKSPAKRREVLGEIANKFCVKIDFSKRRGKMKDTLTNDEQVWINKFLDCPDISYMTPGRKDNVYTGKKNGVKTYEQKRYLLWKIRDIHDILNGGELIGQGNNDSFSDTFGRKLKFTLLYEFLKDHKEYIFNRDIPQWSCLCEVCENVSLLTNGINKLLPSKVPTTLHDIVEEFSCSKVVVPPFQKSRLLFQVYRMAQMEWCQNFRGKWGSQMP